MARNEREFDRSQLMNRSSGQQNIDQKQRGRQNQDVSDQTMQRSDSDRY